MKEKCKDMFVLLMDLSQTPEYLHGASDVAAVYTNNGGKIRYFGDFRSGILKEITERLAQELTTPQRGINHV